MPIRISPQKQKEFYERYTEFLNKTHTWVKKILQAKYQGLDEIIDNVETKKCFIQLYTAVTENRGGFREVIAEQKWAEVVTDV